MSGACERINTYSQGNSSIIVGYEGIPQNLLLNGVTSVILIALFLVIRKIAWRYSQAALLDTTEESKQKRRESWSQFFYGHLSRLNYETEDQTSSSSDTPEPTDARGASKPSVIRQESSLFRSLLAFARLTDEEIGSVAGKDAVRYIRLQRYLFLYLLVVLTFALSIVLPVNIHGGFTNNVGKFSRTTINNIAGESLSLWVHAILSGVYMTLAVIFMCHYSRHVVSFDVITVNPCCLMARGVPELALDEEAIRAHFQDAYPSVVVLNVNLAYNISKLQKLYDESLFVSQVLQICREEAATAAIEGTAGPVVTRCRCSWLCRGCCCGTQDAVAYYADRLDAIGAQLGEEVDQALSRKLPIVFVEFAEQSHARLVLEDFRRAAGYMCGLLPRPKRTPAASSRSDLLQTRNWKLDFAPYPDDVNWHNLAHSASLLWYLRATAINLLLFILLFFFTTPLYIMTVLRLNPSGEMYHHNYISQFLPTLFMWLFSVVLPTVVYYSDVFIQHWTKSSEHYAIMFKCTLFQILMILILPSFGISRADKLVAWMFTMSEKDSESFKERWRCVFVPENAAFFVNYIITTAMIGCCADLLRVSELLNYAFYWLSSKSSAEARLAYKKVQFENQYGFNLSWMLCIFAIVMTYANVAPLILVFGILYMAMKMIVDRYNIYYVYLPSVMDRDVHRLSQSITLVCVFLGEIFILGFFLVRIAERTDGRTVFMLMLVILSLGYILSRTLIHLLKKIGCFGEKMFDSTGIAEENAKSVYLPKVLTLPVRLVRSSAPQANE